MFHRSFPRARWAMVALVAAWLAPPSARGEGEADPRLAGYRTPPGWKVEIAATEPTVVNPVTMTFGPDGRLYVIEWRAGRGPNDHIKVLSDADGDGVFDAAEPYMEGLELPAGLLFWDGWTYVTLDHDVVRFKDKDGDGRFEVREVIASGFGNDDSHHRVSGLAMGPDGWLYMTTGDSDAHAKGSDGSTATVLRCGGVFRCRPDGSRMENVAFGMRNPWGNVAFDDEFRIFHTDNDNEGSAGFTGCRLLHVVEGGDYGWRLREGARCCQPDLDRATWNGGRPGRLGPMAETGRGAPAGLCVLNSPAFPPSTRNLLVYPDVFRKSVRAYRTRPSGASFTIGEEFVLLDSDEGLFRPTDAEIGPDGALYILDWRTDSGGAGKLEGNGTTGRIYRMTWAGTELEPARPTLPRDRLLRLPKADEPGLLTAFKSDDFATRRLAGLELIRRGVRDAEALRALAIDRASPAPARRHALAVLLTTDPAKAKGVFGDAITDPDPGVRRIALEYAARFGPRRTFDPASKDLDPLLNHLRDEDSWRAFAGKEPELARAFVLFLGACQRDAGVAPVPRGNIIERFFEGFARDLSEAMPSVVLVWMRASLADADPFLRDAFTRAIEASGPPALEMVAGFAGGPDERFRASALEILQGWRGEDAASAVVSLATSREEVPAETRAGLFRTLRELGGAVPPDPIVQWLEASPSADPGARAAAIRVLTAMGTRAVLAAGPALAKLLGDPNPDVRRAALGLAGVVRSDEARAVLVGLVRESARPAEERRLAIAALRGYEDKALAPTLDAMLADDADPGVRAELLRTLAALDIDAASRRAEGLLSSPDRELRHTAIELLGRRPSTALVVAERYNAGKMPAEDLSRVFEAVRGHASPELQAATQVMLKDRLLAAPTGPEAQRLRDYVGRFGNPERGKAIYLDAKKGGCITCHRMEGVGGSVGPDLTRLWDTLSFDKRVESILDPSKEIKEGFGTFKVATSSGQTVAGLLLSDTAEGVTLRDAEGREVRIPSAEIEEKGPDATSLMPAGVVGHLSLNELADLLAFLGDRGAQESLRGTSAAPAPKP